MLRTIKVVRLTSGGGIGSLAMASWVMAINVSS
jgi:hypothetical protein